MTVTLPPLPFAIDALEPHIDAQTMQIHHSKHHQTYVDKLNAALESEPSVQFETVEELLQHSSQVPESIATAVRNHGGGHSNHSIFWQLLSPQSGEPTAAVKSAFEQAFNSWENFEETFTGAATNHFGSGWAWVIKTQSGSLAIKSFPNQDSPYMEGNTPILGIDVWEHAYYLKYQNRRPEYIKAFFNVINWAEVDRRISM